MQIILLVDKNGNTQTVTKGAAGSSCMQASEFLEKSLGTVTENTLTDEYYSSNIYDTSSTENTTQAERHVNVYEHT